MEGEGRGGGVERGDLMRDRLNVYICGGKLKSPHNFYQDCSFRSEAGTFYEAIASLLE